MNTKIIPLGGLGEVGKNMYVVMHNSDIIIVDSGVMFPDDELLGIDYVIPDYTFLKENENKIKAIYGETEEKEVNYLSDRLYLSGLKQNIDVAGITKANKCLEYNFNDYGIRFYFDKGGQMVFLAYCKNYDNIPIK